MTSNTSPSGKASASNETYGGAYKAFDGSNATCWYTEESTSNTGFWIQYQFPVPVTIISFEVIPASAPGPGASFLAANATLQVSKDGVNWTTAHTFTTPASNSLIEFEDIIQVKDIKYAKIITTATELINNKYRAGYYHLQFYGYK